jgi:hypothetical protein
MRPPIRSMSGLIDINGLNKQMPSSYPSAAGSVVFNRWTESQTKPQLRATQAICGPIASFRFVNQTARRKSGWASLWANRTYRVIIRRTDPYEVVMWTHFPFQTGVSFGGLPSSVCVTLPAVALWAGRCCRPPAGCCKLETSGLADPKHEHCGDSPVQLR